MYKHYQIKISAILWIGFIAPLIVIILSYAQQVFAASLMRETDKEHMRVFESVCVGSLLNEQAFHKFSNLKSLFDKTQAVPKETLQFGQPGSSSGYYLLRNGKTYFVTFGNRTKKTGGPFCSMAITEDFKFEDALNSISYSYPLLKLVLNTRQGSQNVAGFKGQLIGYKNDMVITIQSDSDISSISIFND